MRVTVMAVLVSVALASVKVVAERRRPCGGPGKWGKPSTHLGLWSVTFHDHPAEEPGVTHEIIFCPRCQLDVPVSAVLRHELMRTARTAPRWAMNLDGSVIGHSGGSTQWSDPPRLAQHHRSRSRSTGIPDVAIDSPTRWCVLPPHDVFPLVDGAAVYSRQLV